MKLLCGIFLLAVVSAEPVPLVGSFPEDVKSTEPPTTITPQLGLLGQFHKSFAEHSKAVADTLSKTLKDITDSDKVSKSSSENSNTLDGSKKASSPSIEWLDFPLGGLYEWLEKKAAVVKESKLRLMWQNRNKRSHDDTGDKKSVDSWDDWSPSEARFIESLFEDYPKGGGDLSEKSGTGEEHPGDVGGSDTEDGYEVQEFSEDDLKDIEPVQTQDEEDGKILVTPTYPSVEEYTLVKDGKKPSNHPEHQDHGGHEDHWVYEDHDDHRNQEDYGYPEGHSWYEDHGNPDDHSWYDDHGNPEDQGGFYDHYKEEDVPVMHTGEISGTPGVEFPDYKDIPASSFNCTEYASVPGFYADMETGCQVFHVCYENKKASFLCPVGTVFNQAVLSCDFWHRSNCSQTPQYYSLNHGFGVSPTKKVDESTTVSPQKVKDVSYEEKTSDDSDEAETPEMKTSKTSKKKYPDLPPSEYLKLFMQFFPVRAKVSVIPVRGKTRVVAVASIGERRHKSKNGRPGVDVKAKSEVHLDRDGKAILGVQPVREAKPFEEDSQPDREIKPFEEDSQPDREIKPFEEEHPDHEERPHFEGDEEYVEHHHEDRPHFEDDDHDVGSFDEKPTYVHKDYHEVQEHIDEAFDIVRRILGEIRHLLEEQDDYYPHRRPTRRPTKYPTRRPTKYPTRRPTKYPTRRPTRYPSRRPTGHPSRRPTRYPTRKPTGHPSRRPTRHPTRKPTRHPSRRPTRYPTRRPTWHPSRRPTRYPTRRPYPPGRPCRCYWYSKEEVIPYGKYGKYPRRPGPCRCYWYKPLTPINPRFVVKPVQTAADH
ncbi:hypothetical protein JTE90_004562 [Oedothorax gibbosus]|uniref:Chitin-binding type-2 domain-containing protein n=1 Tax=Oedothorax gibbosus TaxID=931172 RepID=A0AAV6UJU6_9ARAC|nr:hypothetical protein JTE90_004562 [Oedothorax gibbosus]